MNEIIVTTKADIIDIVRESVFQAMERFTKSPEEKKTETREADHEYTIKELAAYWKCHVQTIMNKKRAGELPFHQHGRKVFFKKSEIDALTANPVFNPGL